MPIYSVASHPRHNDFKIPPITTLNPSPAEPRYTLPLQSVDLDQMASEEVN